MARRPWHYQKPSRVATRILCISTRFLAITMPHGTVAGKQWRERDEDNLITVTPTATRRRQRTSLPPVKWIVETERRFQSHCHSGRWADCLLYVWHCMVDRVLVHYHAVRAWALTSFNACSLIKLPSENKSIYSVSVKSPLRQRSDVQRCNIGAQFNKPGRWQTTCS